MKQDISSPYKNLAAVVVWFNPINSDCQNIQTYSNYVDHLYIVDNSEFDNSDRVGRVSNVTYISLRRNMGLAHALNVGLRCAAQAEFGFVMTIDQDSAFGSTSIERFLVNAVSAFSTADVAVLAPAIHAQEKQCSDLGFVERTSVITSGNIVRLSAWSKVGGYYEKFFIDQIDHEFCFRLRMNGFRILQDCSTLMLHTIGQPIEARIFGFNLVSSNHSAIRRYYYVRNACYLRTRYPQYAKPVMAFVWDLLLVVALIVVVENGALKKLKAMLMGMWDFCAHKYGSWDEHHSNRL